ncbi:cysteine protease ATG4B-like isoform X2 [Cimex lectularius]|uniref:Cysteine protease n=1 Tax=Cimex lectularius TaxID=79782 RepID=A0A8I6THK6_CIMLE|nr:cysteine protease ATG4B-like isoform X2 [Cimex lectularius]
MEFRQLVKKRSRNKILYQLKMDMMFEAYLTHDSDRPEPDDIPQTNEPVWILGKKYNTVHDIELIRSDIRSRLWFTYRKNFIPIGDSGKTSDKGWGCMLRCGQMLMAQALLNHHLGRDWLWNISYNDEKYVRIVKMFEDRKSAGYSIHQIALMGASEGKQVGDWFGPNTVAQVLKKLARYDDWSNLAVHVALDNTIVLNEICSLQRTRWKPLVLIVPLRLGINEINSIYIQGLKACFTFPQSLGAIGGKPNHALYFIGIVGNDVIFLDPHVTQMSGSLHNKTTEQERKIDNSYHCHQASRLHILHMDPSVAVGFFCKSEEDFNLLIKQIRETVMLDKQPLFEIRDKSHVPWAERGQEATSLAHVHVHRHRNRDDSDEDFEIIE